MTYAGTKRDIFVSHYKGDLSEVQKFIKKWSKEKGVFTAKQLGVFDDEDFINSTDTNYVMSQIRKKYLKDSIVTIVLMGECTHSRRYVDWEIKASLQQGDSSPNGLLGIVLPSLNKKSPNLPDRFSRNFKNNSPSYASYYYAPTSAEQLGQWIENAYASRTDKEKLKLISNPNEMMKYNKKCSVHKKTH